MDKRSLYLKYCCWFDCLKLVDHLKTRKYVEWHKIIGIEWRRGEAQANHAVVIFSIKNKLYLYNPQAGTCRIFADNIIGAAQEWCNRNRAEYLGHINGSLDAWEYRMPQETNQLWFKF